MLRGQISFEASTECQPGEFFSPQTDSPDQQDLITVSQLSNSTAGYSKGHAKEFAFSSLSSIPS